MCDYLKSMPRVPQIDDAHITNPKLDSYESSEKTMLSYPVGTQFLVYSTHLLTSHWTYAERWPDEIRFYDYQIDIPKGHEFAYDSSESQRGSVCEAEVISDHSHSSSSSSDISPWETEKPQSSPSIPMGLLDKPIAFSEAKTLSLEQNIVSSSHTFLSITLAHKKPDPRTINRDRPYPVIELDGKRYVFDPSEVGFIACISDGL